MLTGIEMFVYVRAEFITYFVVDMFVFADVSCLVHHLTGFLISVLNNASQSRQVEEEQKFVHQQILCMDQGWNHLYVVTTSPYQDDDAFLQTVNLHRVDICLGGLNVLCLTSSTSLGRFSRFQERLLAIFYIV